MRRPLRCRADGSFTIVQFTDTHFGNGEVEDDRTAALMERVLDLEQPDLVVFTGDVLGGQGGTRNARAAWARATAPLVARDLRWCAVFGNHDDECDASRAELLALSGSLALLPPVNRRSSLPISAMKRDGSAGMKSRPCLRRSA